MTDKLRLVVRALDLGEMIRGTSIRPGPEDDEEGEIDWDAVHSRWWTETVSFRQERDWLLSKRSHEQ